MDVDTVPVIDMAGPEEQAAPEVRDACLKHGFFFVRNHGVPPEVIDKEFESSKAFFSLPLEAKMALHVNDKVKGYTPFQDQTLDPSTQTQPDTKEGFYIGLEVQPDKPAELQPLAGGNQWPAPGVLDGFKEAQEAYREAVVDLAMRIVRLLALALELPADHFAPLFRPPIVSLRPLHYWATPSRLEEGILGAGAHTDWGMLTVLATDGVPGLQLHYQGEWVDVPHKPGCFIINIGDAFERWTNCRFRSTLHRVANLTGVERFSVACFLEPAYDTVVEVLPQCCGDGEPARFPPISVGQYLRDKYAQTQASYRKPAPGGPAAGIGAA